MSAHPQKVHGRSRRSPIETQINRRKKALPLSPLEPEWDCADQAKPAHLRMSSSLMGPLPKPLRQFPDKTEDPDEIERNSKHLS